MIDMKKKYKTRSGIPVRILAVDAKGDFPVVGLLQTSPDRDTLLNWRIDGRAGVVETDYDLVEANPEFWVNIYWDISENRTVHGISYYTEEAAKKRSGSQDIRLVYITTFKIPDNSHK